MHQIGVGITGVNPSKLHGFTPNPVNPNYHPGASSSGTVAAIAIGLVPCGIGTDGGGSVRIPAAFTDTSAIKPTAGRIPHRGYNGGTNSTIGPMANTMVDCAKLYSVIAGPDQAEESYITWYQPKIEIPKSIKTNLNGLKVGIDYDWVKAAKPDIKRVFDDKLKMLEEYGAKLVPIAVSDMMNLGAAHFMTFVTEIIPSVVDHFENQENIGLGLRTKLTLPFYVVFINYKTLCSDVMAFFHLSADTMYASDYNLCLKFRK